MLGFLPRSLLLLIFSLGLATVSSAQQDLDCSPYRVGPNCESIYRDDYAAAEKLQHALAIDDRRTVAEMIRYPQYRDQPLPALQNAGEFIEHWDEFFDAANTKETITTKAEEIGWRGVQIANGSIWFLNGKINVIHYRTEKSKEILRAAIKAESVGLYSSARDYDSIQFQCKTANFQVRVQHHKDDLRYFVWKNGAALSSQPELELHSGEIVPDGTGGNYLMIFKNGIYTYQVEVMSRICSEDNCNDYLTVLKNDKAIYGQICGK